MRDGLIEVGVACVGGSQAQAARGRPARVEPEPGAGAGSPWATGPGGTRAGRGENLLGRQRGSKWAESHATRQPRAAALRGVAQVTATKINTPLVGPPRSRGRPGAHPPRRRRRGRGGGAPPGRHRTATATDAATTTTAALYTVAFWQALFAIVSDHTPSSAFLTFGQKSFLTLSSKSLDQFSAITTDEPRTTWFSLWPLRQSSSRCAGGGCSPSC